LASGGCGSRRTASGCGTPPRAPAAKRPPCCWRRRDRLFPLRGYRLLEHPGDNPQFGLNPPAATFTVFSGEGETTVAIGAATFNGGGYYARVARRPGDLFLLPRSILADLQSLVEGRPVAPPQPEDERIARVLAGGGGPPDDGSENPWVRQALESGATLPSGQR